MSDSTEEWQVARRRKGPTRKCKSHAVSLNSPSQERLDVGKHVKRIRDTMSDLRCEEFWFEWKTQLLLAASSFLQRSPVKQECVDELNPGDAQLECVCYGLGSFSSCFSARFQLAMLMLLLDAAQIPLQDCCVYDPAFSSDERHVLSKLGLTVLTENEEGKRLATKPTLFYLMHCGKALYNNLLWKNWSSRSLSLVMIIGNSFNSISERTIERELKRDYSYISEAVGLCEERTLPCPSHLIDVFSDTALITFPSDSLNRLPQSFWTEPPEPQYVHCSELEIVLREAPQTDVEESRRRHPLNNTRSQETQRNLIELTETKTLLLQSNMMVH